MSTYTNPTGTFDATAGDDTFKFTAVPSAGTTTAIDALGGHDSLLVQVAFAGAMNFDATDNGGASFTATIRFGPDDGLITVYDVESVEFDGTTNDDTFNVKLGGTTAGEFVKIDGGAGNDSLHLDVSSLTTDFSFVDGGSAIASSWGSFSNLESFEIRTGSGNDTITTGGGNDNISTGTGADNVSAGAGNDYIYSQASSGTIDGGDGYDTFSGGPVTAAAETINLSETITFSTGLTIKNIESFGLAGGSGDDLFVDTLSANGGSLYGGDGRDTLVYGAPSNAGIQVSVQAHSDQVEGSVGPSGNQLNFYQFETLNITGTQYDDHFQINAYYPVTQPRHLVRWGCRDGFARCRLQSFPRRKHVRGELRQHSHVQQGPFRQYRELQPDGGLGGRHARNWIRQRLALRRRRRRSPGWGRWRRLDLRQPLHRR